MADGDGGERACAVPGCELPRDDGRSFCAAHGQIGGQDSAPAKKSSGCAVVIALAVLLALAGWGCSLLTGDDKEGETGGARYACHDWVEQRLKSPGSANFEDYDEGSVTRTGDTVVVRGWVDSDNSFGASVRNTYTCTVTVVGDKYRLVSIGGLTN